MRTIKQLSQLLEKSINIYNLYSPEGYLDTQLLRRHLSRHPQSNATSHKPEPNHKIVLLGTREFGYCIAKQARMDEKGGNASNWVVLGQERHQRVSWLQKGDEALTSAEIPPIPPTPWRRPLLYSSGTSRRNTVSTLKAGSSEGRPCRENHKHGTRYVGCKWISYVTYPNWLCDSRRCRTCCISWLAVCLIAINHRQGLPGLLLQPPSCLYLR